MVTALIALLAGQQTLFIERFIGAVNSKDRSVFESHFKEFWDDQQKPAVRADRLWPLCENGSPFKIVRQADSGPGYVRALVEDKEGERWALMLILTGEPMKIGGLRLTAPESLRVPPPKPNREWKDLTDLVDGLMADLKVPAMAIAYQRGGEPVRQTVRGVRKINSADKAEASDLWHVGSIGKSLTSTLIARLIEKGVLKWNSTLQDCLPGVPMRDEYKAVTLEQVMKHRGGLPKDMGFTLKEVKDICGDEVDPVKIRTRYSAHILSRAPIGKAGEHFDYSNAGYSLLGHIAEVKLKKPFEILVKDHVFIPLGLKNSFAGRPGAPYKMPAGHALDDDGVKPLSLTGQINDLVRPAGDYWMSIEDLLRFGREHMLGLKGQSKFLKRETFERLHKGLQEPENDSLYACGWVIDQLPGVEAERHGHNGSNGTFTAELAFFPKLDLVIASAVNRGGEDMPGPALQALTLIAQRHQRS
ncbi:MAG TPA: serine hydrolase domain-containing protein [Fimbriimonadaceae bacterium]|nr:serine hydrolase domain-containing protein [Fimbriimonadaceae bacterium]